MHTKHAYLISGLCLSVFSTGAFSSTLFQGSGMSVKGATGLIVIPTADVLEFGAVAGGYNNFLLPHHPSNYQPTNSMFSVGAWHNLEFQVRLSESTDPRCVDNAYNCGGVGYKRDLSGNAKLQLPIRPMGIKLAVGGQDIAGKVIQERRYYGVATYDYKNTAITLGYAHDPGTNIIQSDNHLSGVFYGVNTQLPYGLRVMAENDGVHKRAALGWEWAHVLGTQAYLGVQANLYSDNSNEQSSYSLTVTVPLGEKAETVAVIEKNTKSLPPVFERKESEFMTQLEGGYWVPKIESNSRDHLSMLKDDTPQDLSQDLIDAGLEFVSVGRDDKQRLVVQYQNRLHSWSEQDALIQVMAVASRYALAKNISQIRLITLREQTPVLATYFAPQWLDSSTPKDISNIQDYTPRFKLINDSFFSSEMDSIRWDYESPRQSWAAVEFSPKIRNVIGTEFGNIDYSLAMQTRLQVPLWKGGRAEVSRLDPIDHSFHYSEGGYWENDAFQSEWDVLTLQQTFSLWPGLINSSIYRHDLSPGRKTDVFINQSRLYMDNGQHQFYGYWAYVNQRPYAPLRFEGNQYAFGYLGYELFLPKYRLSFSAESGRFMHDDETKKLTVKTYLGDSVVRGSLIEESKGWQKVYVSLTVPLTPRKALALGPITVSGDEKWSYGIQTVTADPYDASININVGDVRYQSFGFYVAPDFELHENLMDNGRITPAAMLLNLYDIKNKVNKINKVFFETRSLK